jgi:hypothetical protein
MHDCLVSAIRVALNCCSQAPHQRLGMRMQRQSCAWLMMLVFVPLFNKISVNVVSWSSVAWLCVAVEWVETAGRGSGRGHQHSFQCVLVESPAKMPCKQTSAVVLLFQASNRLTKAWGRSANKHCSLGRPAVRQWTDTPSLCGNWRHSEVGCQPSNSCCHLEWQQLQSPHRMTEDWRKTRGSTQLKHRLLTGKLTGGFTYFPVTRSDAPCLNMSEEGPNSRSKTSTPGFGPADAI